MRANIKTDLFLDFDNTITSSSERICQMYNNKYKHHPNFKEAKWWETNQYNMLDVCTLATLEEIKDMFCKPEFFEGLEFINGNTYEVLQEVNEKYNIIICSIGRRKNIAYKSLWLEDNLPFIENDIFVNNGTCVMSKEIVNMQVNPSIFIDDVISNLDSANADFSFIFGDEYSWNLCPDGKYKRLINYTDVANTLLKNSI